MEPNRDPRSTIGRLVAGALAALQVSRVAIYRVEPENRFDCLAVAGVAPGDADLALLRRAVTERQPLWAADLLAVPAVDGDLVVAGLAGGRPFGAPDAELLHLFVEHALLELRSAAVRAAEARLLESERLEALARLAGGVAHEFNNLVTVIAGRAEQLLSRPTLDAAIRPQIARIKASAERLATLTQQLTTFAGRQILQPKVLEVDVLVGSVERLLRGVIGEDIEVLVFAGAPGARVFGDPSQLEQAVLALALHGRDAMPQGGRLILATAAVDVAEAEGAAYGLAAGRYVRLGVRDSGAGLVPDAVRHLFDPFFTPPGFGPGGGLGLAAAYGVVRQSGGTIRVQSERDSGTEFHVYLPITTQPAPALPASAPSGAGEPLVLPTTTVLVAEDEEAVLELVHEILADAGYRVLAARTPAEAMHLGETHDGPIHLLLTDVVMPRTSGRDVAERLLRARPDIRVLYMSGHTDQILGPHGAPATGVPVLAKPFSKGALLGAVRTALEIRAAAPAEDVSAGLGLPKVVVRFTNGTLVKGYTRDFHPNKPRFQVFRGGEPAEQSLSVAVKDLKAVFFVRDFAGNPRYEERKAFAEGTRPTGRKVEVKFFDGEVLVGYTHGYDPQRPGFFLFPADPQSNNLRIFVVTAGVAALCYI